MADKIGSFHSRKEYRRHCKNVNRLFLDEHRREVFIHYVRERTPLQVVLDEETFQVVDIARVGRGRPTAVLVAYRHHDGSITYGWSAAHPTKEKTFDKAVGLRKALSRAVEASGDDVNFPTRLMVPMVNFKGDAEWWFSSRPATVAE